jgi:hypothetical protein
MRSNPDEVREFVEELLRTGCVLTDLLGALLDELPEDAFPGEHPAEVLIEMLTGTVRPVAEAAGAEVVRTTIALLDAVGNRTIADLRAAAERAGDA